LFVGSLLGREGAGKQHSRQRQGGEYLDWIHSYVFCIGFTLGAK
jgi:hypothetical protein